MRKRQRFDGKLYFRRKTQAVRMLGGKCEACEETDYYVLHFHHTGKKRYSLSEVFGDPDVDWSDIEQELRVCKLLCANDHARHHARVRKDAWERKNPDG